LNPKNNIVLEINLIIRELLAKHDFISLPGIGSFTQKYEPAFPSADGISFIPPKQIISFDTSRTFNDEAIENYLCDKLGVSHTEASDLLKEYISRLNYDLDSGKPRTFENVGELYKNKKGRIRFDQAADVDAALSTFGLKSLEVEKVNPRKIKKTKGQKDYATKAGNTSKKYSSNKILVIFSLLIVIAALTTTFILVPELRFWDNILNTKKSVAENAAELAQKSEETKLTDSVITKKDSLIEKVDQSIKENNNKKTALNYEEPKVQDNKTYYLIVGSFGKIENAQKLFETYKQKGYSPEIIQGNSMFRVSIGKTTDKNKALSDFNKYRTNYPNQPIWILGI